MKASTTKEVLKSISDAGNTKQSSSIIFNSPPHAPSLFAMFTAADTQLFP